MPIDADTAAALPPSPRTPRRTDYRITSQCPYGFTDRQFTPAEQRPYTLTMLADTPTATECVFECPTTYIPDDQRNEFVTQNAIVGAVTLLSYSGP